jgi:photosystem II stability/assembly factor-like uncharacterized protein
VAIARAGARLVAVGDRGVVLLSDDQGGSWTEVASGSAVLLTALAFISPQEGWAVGQDSTILHTRDAGAHWTIQLSKPKADQALFSVAYLGPGTGGAHLIATGAYALALETQDGGRHWDSVKLPAMDDDYHLNCALGLEGGAGLVITGEAGHAFIRRDGVWAAMKLPYDGSQFGCLAGRGGAIYSFGLRGSLFVAHPGPPNPASPPPASLPPAPRVPTMDAYPNRRAALPVRRNSPGGWHIRAGRRQRAGAACRSRQRNIAHRPRADQRYALGRGTGGGWRLGAGGQ